MNRDVVNRRQVLVAAIGSGLLLEPVIAQDLTQSDSGLLPPPPPTLEEHVRDADLIFIGVIERFVFFGHSQVLIPDEYNKDFNEDNDMGNRSLHAFVRVSSVLKDELGFKVNRVVRMSRPVPRDGYRSHLRKRQMFFAKKGVLLHGDDSESRLYRSVVDALPMKNEVAVRQIVARLKKTHNR